MSKDNLLGRYQQSTTLHDTDVAYSQMILERKICCRHSIFLYWNSFKRIKKICKSRHSHRSKPHRTYKETTVPLEHGRRWVFKTKVLIMLMLERVRQMNTKEAATEFSSQNPHVF